MLACRVIMVPSLGADFTSVATDEQAQNSDQ
jgi:hypothetical protein